MESTDTAAQKRTDERQRLQQELTRDLAQVVSKCFAEPMPMELFAAEMLVGMLRREYQPETATADDEYRVEEHLNAVFGRIERFGRTDSERRAMLADFTKRVLKSALSSTAYTLERDEAYMPDVLHQGATLHDIPRNDGQC